METAASHDPQAKSVAPVLESGEHIISHSELELIPPLARTSEQDDMSTEDSESDVEIIMEPLKDDEITDLTRSSARSQPGVCDSSMDTHPHSPWYIAYTSPTPPGGAQASRAFLLRYPTILGSEGQREEERRVSKARAKQPLAERAALHPDSLLPTGRWETREFTTLVQAENLRQFAVVEKDMYAARRYRGIVKLHADNPNEWRSEGVRYLLRTFSGDVAEFPFDGELSGRKARKHADVRVASRFDADGNPCVREGAA